ncbi:MAG: hypothetical protein KJN77_07550 [Gammaproteobacteria bacterium]|nr:hypothetical protein [Gammaproteobacteria bacterium]
MQQSPTRKPANTAWQLAALLCALLAMLAACGAPSSGPEEELRDWVRHGVEAAESKQRRALMAMVSPAYADARGNQRNGIDAMLRVYFMRMNTVQLITSIEEISVIGDSAAEVVLKVGMAGTHDGVLGFSADAYRFAFELQRHDNEWLLIAARWGEWGKELR